MIRRWVEWWLGYDRLLVAYEKVKRDNENLTQSRERLRESHRKLVVKHDNTVARLRRQRAEVTKLHQLYTRALVELEWERFLAEENAPDSLECVKIKLMNHDQAWEVADLLTERFRQPLFAYWCEQCPRNPITRSNWWHVTRRKRKRRA